MSFIAEIGANIFEGYLTLLAYIFTLFLEYTIFTSIFKHEETPEGETVRLRWSNNEDKNIKTKVKLINLGIFLILVPFTIHPLLKIMEHYLADSGYYIVPLTFLAAALGYLSATKEHIEHQWQKEDTLILSSGIALFVMSIVFIIRLHL